MSRSRGQPAGSRASKVDSAASVLARELRRGPRRARDVIAALNAAGVAERTRKRARSSGAYVTRRVAQAWWWALPEHEQQLLELKAHPGVTGTNGGGPKSKGAKLQGGQTRASKRARGGKAKGANQRPGKGARGGPQGRETCGKINRQAEHRTGGLVHARARVEILMPREPHEDVKIHDPLASTVAEELAAFAISGGHLLLAAATVTARPGADVRARASQWAALLAEQGGGCWLVAEHEGRIHFHGLVLAPDLALATSELDRDPAGSPDGRCIDPITSRSHLRRVVRYATKAGDWDPAEVVASGCLLGPWRCACSKCGVPDRRREDESIPPIESDAWIEEMSRWPASLLEVAAEQVVLMARFKRVNDRQLQYWAYMALRGYWGPKWSAAGRPVDTQRGTSSDHSAVGSSEYGVRSCR